jgi:hypothetical protein
VATFLFLYKYFCTAIGYVWDPTASGAKPAKNLSISENSKAAPVLGRNSYALEKVYP